MIVHRGRMPPAPPAPTALPAWSRWLAVALIVTAGFAVYGPALRGGWVWDDHLDLPNNPVIRSPDGLAQIWTEPGRLLDFYPLKHSLQWLQWRLWENDTLGYHLTSLGLHLAAALLFWRVLGRLGLRHGWLGALLFTVHPLCVESVAWIVELKNTLSLPPLLLAVDAFLRHADSGRRRDLGAAWAWFLVSLLCKTGGIMLPCFLVLLLWWRRGRPGAAELRTTAPFFALSLALGLVTLWFQHHRAQAGEDITAGEPLQRLVLAGQSVVFYLQKSLWPAGLMPLYPQWPVTPASPLAWWPWPAGLAGLAWAWRRRASWGRHALLGGGWFLLHLLPFVGLITISFMRFTWVMDHLAYLPLLGLLGLLVAGLEALLARRPASSRRLALAGAAALCLVPAAVARKHAAIFRSEESFWSAAVQGNPRAWFAHYNLAVVLRQRGDPAGAGDHFAAALAINPADAFTHHALAQLHADAGRAPEAEFHLREALRLDPRPAETHHSLGVLLQATGRPAAALAEYREALRLQPGYAIAENSLGLVLCDLGRLDEAAARFEAALRLNPGYAEAHANLGNLLLQAGRTDAALDHYREAVRLLPDAPELHINLANVLQDAGRHAEAAAGYEQALQLRPDIAVAHHRLALSLAALGQPDRARAHLEAAQRLENPPR